MLQSGKREPERKAERKAEPLEQPLVPKSEVESPWLGPAGAAEPRAAAPQDVAPSAEAPGAAPALLSSRVVAAIQGTGAAAVREHAQEWSELCQRDLRKALLEVLEVVLELAGLPGSLQDPDVDGDPKAFLQRLPEWVRLEGLDLQVWPLMPTARHGKRSLMNFERFWTFAINAQNASTLLEGRVVAKLSEWFLAMANATIRSLRHVSTAAALAIAEGLGHQHQALNRQHDTVKRQLESAGASNHRQKEQLQKNLQKASAQVGEMYRARTQLLEAIVPNRSRDVSEIIRLHTLCEVEKLMRQDPEMYLSNKWTARVFLMIHDPAVEVRLKAIQVIQSWYTGIQKSEAVRQHLNHFAQRGLSHLVERIADVDPRVAAAALRCLRAPVLAESLEDEEFDKIVNLVVGSEDDSVREEAALFINSHVFQDPGICGPVLERRKGRPKSGGDGDAADTLDGGEGGEGGEGAGGRDAVRELYNSETSISMLVEYLENYVGDHLRISERVVAAFWSRAPALCHWGTMVNLCLVGESQRGASMDPVSPRQRLALLYIMEAAVRRAWEDFQQSERASDKEVAAVKLNDACAKIIPELPRLLEVCRSDDQHTLLFSHACKILLEYAVDSTQIQIIVNTKALCEGLRRAIESQAPQDTVKYCVDGLLALARCFDEAKAAFLDLAKATHHECSNEIQNYDGSRAEQLRSLLGRLVVLGNRGIDMTFGSMPMLNGMVDLLNSRAEWQRDRRPALAAAATPRRAADAEMPQAEEKRFFRVNGFLDLGLSLRIGRAYSEAELRRRCRGDGLRLEALERFLGGADGALVQVPAPPPWEATEAADAEAPQAEAPQAEAPAPAAAQAAEGEAPDAEAEPDGAADRGEEAADADAAADAGEADRPPAVPDQGMSLQLLEAAAVAVLWRCRMAYWVEAYSREGGSVEAQVSEMLQGFSELPQLRAELPRTVAKLRETCALIVAHDSNPYLQFHAFSAYMTLLQNAYGVSDKLDLENVDTVVRENWFSVTVPLEHNAALWHYLNSFYIRISGVDGEGVKFDAEGYNVTPVNVYPAPSLGTMTSVRFFTQRCMQLDFGARGGVHLDRKEELLLATLASRMVLESQVEDVHSGPLGLLLLTQCERGRPKALREIAMSSFRKLREIARTSEELGVQFFRMQQEAVASLFECVGTEAAMSLSTSFVRQWGPKMLPWLKTPHSEVIRDAAARCITEDKHRLPLLDVFGTWLRVDTIPEEARCAELSAELLEHCKRAGFDGESDAHVRRYLHRLQYAAAPPAAPPAAPLAAPAAAPAAAPMAAPAAAPATAAAASATPAGRTGTEEVVVIADADSPAQPPRVDPPQAVATPQARAAVAPPGSSAGKPWFIPTQRISGKRSADACGSAGGTPAAASTPAGGPAPGTAALPGALARKRAKTSGA